MASHILNCAFNILNMSCPCYWLVIPHLVFCQINNMHDECGYAGSMHIHDGGYYPHHEAAQFVAKSIHAAECYYLMTLSHMLYTFMVETANFNGLGKNSAKALNKPL